MMKFGHISAIAILSTMTLAAPVVASEQNETERVDRTVQIRAGGQLRLKNFSGKVTITGSNRSDVVVHAVRRAPRERLDHIKLEIVETASGVSIEANKKDDELARSQQQRRRHRVRDPGAGGRVARRRRVLQRRRSSRASGAASG